MIRQVTALVENRPGRLSEILKTLSDNHINLAGISIADSVDFGLFRMILSDPAKGQQVLKKAGFVVQSADVLCLEIADEAGALQNAFDAIAKEHVNIQYVYAFGHKLAEPARIIIKADDNEKASRILRDLGLKDLSYEELI